MNRATVLILVCAALAAAQEKATVPLSDPAQPATVKARLIWGSITVTVGTGPQVVVESQVLPNAGRDRIPARTPPSVPSGMHRLEAGGRGFQVEEDHNVVTIGGAHGDQSMDLMIQVPLNTSVELKTVNGGPIEVTGINGDMDVENTNGSIELKNVSGAVSAHSMNGSVTVNMARIVPDKPMSFSSLNGKIDVTIPADTKARLRMKTANGEIYTDFDVKTEPHTGNLRTYRGTTVSGSINGGGPEYSFKTLNGTIMIHKK
jgi:hypothetical protein